MAAAPGAGMPAVALAFVCDFENLCIQIRQTFDNSRSRQGNTFLKGFTSTCAYTPACT